MTRNQSQRIRFVVAPVNSVRIVARLMIRNSETTRLEIVSKVRRLFRRMFLKISLLNFIDFPAFTVKSNVERSDRHPSEII